MSGLPSLSHWSGSLLCSNRPEELGSKRESAFRIHWGQKGNRLSLLRPTCRRMIERSKYFWNFSCLCLLVSGPHRSFSRRRISACGTPVKTIGYHFTFRNIYPCMSEVMPGKFSGLQCQQKVPMICQTRRPVCLNPFVGLNKKQ